MTDLTDPNDYDRISHTIHLSIKLKDALESAAIAADLPLTTFMREVLAAHIHYDLQAERQARPERRGRPRKYPDSDTRQAARRARDNARKARVRALVTEYKQQQVATIPTPNQASNQASNQAPKPRGGFPLARGVTAVHGGNLTER